MKLIVPPRKYPDAIPTHRGWEANGEVVEARPFGDAEITAYLQAKGKAQPAPQPAPAPVVEEPAVEEVVADEPEEEHDELSIGNLMGLTKEGIEQIGRKYGIELDRRNTKENMIEELLDFVEE